MVHSPLYERNQSTPTTETVARIYSSCVTLFELPFCTFKYYQVGMPFFVRNLIIRMVLPTRVRAVFHMALLV